MTKLDRLPKVIGLLGKMKVGKDTVANTIVNRCRDLASKHACTNPCKIVPFAKALREEVALALCNGVFPVDDLEHQNYSGYWEARRAFFECIAEVMRIKGAVKLHDFQRYTWEKPTPKPLRLLLQWWGTDYRRQNDENYWIRKWYEGNFWHFRYQEIILVPDVRFQNEVSLCNGLGTTIWITGRDQDAEGIIGHASENVPDWLAQHEIVNDGTLDQLNDKIVALLEELWR